MKKVFIMAAIALMATASVKAEEKNQDAVRVDYNINMNDCALSRCLNLNGEQADVMEYASDMLREEVSRVRFSKEEKKAARLKRAIARNLSIAHKHLEDKQYRSYLALLNQTFKNKGLNSILINEEQLASK